MVTLRQSAEQAETQKPTMSIQEVADFLGISVSHVYEMLCQGQIPHRKLGKKYIISRKQVNDWLNNAPAIPITKR
jgi:excisionase family DNA binding protein